MLGVIKHLQQAEKRKTACQIDPQRVYMYVHIYTL